MYLDRSVLEVIANGRACLSSRICPTRPDGLGVGLFSGGAVVLEGSRLVDGSIWYREGEQTVEYRTLGAWSVRVDRQLRRRPGDEFGRSDPAEGRQAVARAIDLGMNYFDVSPTMAAPWRRAPW